ncbi:MAG: hypothetical protein ACYTG1_13710 [Planctomycetota bacterium]|jgi:hypothetical protein
MVRHAEAVRRYELHLDEPAGAGPGTDERVLPVPEGISYMTLPADAPARLDPRPSETPDGPVYLVEPLVRRQDAICVLVAPADHPVRVNGEALTHLACLGHDDVVELPGCRTGRVALHRSSRPGRPPADLVGRACPLCTRPFTGTTTVWICPACRTALHAEAGDGDDVLRCVTIGTECPSCGEVIDRPEGEA